MLSEIRESIVKLDKKQTETAINIEEIQFLLEETRSGQADILNALISVIDYFDDFYSFAEKDTASPLFRQAEMMLNGIVKKTSKIGLTRIRDTYTEFDHAFNSVEFAEENSGFSDGHITKTLRCGYVYNGEVIRKSKVVVVK